MDLLPLTSRCDSKVIPQDIDWIIARAVQRKAPFPSAFMSSKPDAGINHKVGQACVHGWSRGSRANRAQRSMVSVCVENSP